MFHFRPYSLNFHSKINLIINIYVTQVTQLHNPSNKLDKKPGQYFIVAIYPDSISHSLITPYNDISVSNNPILSPFTTSSHFCLQLNVSNPHWLFHSTPKFSLSYLSPFPNLTPFSNTLPQNR